MGDDALKAPKHCRKLLGEIGADGGRAAVADRSALWPSRRRDAALVAPLSPSRAAVLKAVDAPPCADRLRGHLFRAAGMEAAAHVMLIVTALGVPAGNVLHTSLLGALAFPALFTASTYQ